VTAYTPFRKKRTYTLSAVIILLALLISLSAYRNMFGVRSILISAVYPFQFAVSSLWKGVTGIPSSVLNLRNLAKENAALKQKLNLTLPKLALQDELSAENERLRQALGFKYGNRYGFNLLPAAVIGRGASPWYTTLEINRGTSSGVKMGMPVIVKEGLVGRVIETAAFSSRVLLITDPDSGVVGADQRSRDYGLIEGYLPELLLMKHVSSAGDIRAEDKIVTSSISSIFPAGIPIGTVVRATKKEHDLFYQIEVRPSVKFSRLEEVFLVL